VSSDVFILGAGFSRAAHEEMPTLPDLGSRLSWWIRKTRPYNELIPASIYDLLEIGKLPGGDLEVWLSSLAERQPFLEEADTSLNYALFVSMTRELVSIVQQSQQGYWATAPAWLHHIVRIWHRMKPTVVTFNYDTIVEDTMIALDPPGTSGWVRGAMLRYLPRPAVGGHLGSAPPTQTFHLIKLHGSVDWFWTPGDTTGDSLCTVPSEATQDDRDAALAGKDPFIIPPLSTKSSFFSLALVRERWQQAARALGQAERIMVMGYSVPLTDMSTVAMITQSVRSKVRWHIADPQASDVASRLERMGFAADRITQHPSLDDFLAWYANDTYASMTRVLLNDLVESNVMDGAPILVVPQRQRGHIASGLRLERERLVLYTQNLGHMDPIPADYPRTEHLRAACERVARPVVAEVDGGECAVLGLADPYEVRGTHAVLEWCPLEVQDLPQP
jgi:hypothetical protein